MLVLECVFLQKQKADFSAFCFCVTIKKSKKQK